MYGELRLLYDSFQGPICLNLTRGQDKGSAVFMMCCLKPKSPLEEVKLVWFLMAFASVLVNSVSQLGCTGAQVVETLFLDLPVRVFLGEISIPVNRLSKEDLLSPVPVGIIFHDPLLRGTECNKKRMNFLSLQERKHHFSPALGHRSSWLLGLWIRLGLNHQSPVSQPFRLGLNYTVGSPSCPACRWQILR